MVAREVVPFFFQESLCLVFSDDYVSIYVLTSRKVVRKFVVFIKLEEVTF